MLPCISFSSDLDTSADETAAAAELYVAEFKIEPTQPLGANDAAPLTLVPERLSVDPVVVL